jgi:Tfp pilus assembly protein PilP
MKHVQPFSRLIAFFALLLWCGSLSGAQQIQRIPANPRLSKPPAAKTNTTKPSAGMQASPKHTAKPVAKRQVRPDAKGAHEKAAETRVPHTRPLPAQVEVAPQTPSVVAPLPPPPPVAVEEAMHARDPFAPLVRASEPDAGHANLPPGIAGLQVATMRLEGMVKTSDGVLAVVANPEDHVYFLHTGDHIFDGVVEKIELAQITFQQESKDAFGRVVQRDVTKRLNPIAGDEQ